MDSNAGILLNMKIAILARPLSKSYVMAVMELLSKHLLIKMLLIPLVENFYSEMYCRGLPFPRQSS